MQVKKESKRTVKQTQTELQPDIVDEKDSKIQIMKDYFTRMAQEVPSVMVGPLHVEISLIDHRNDGLRDIHVDFYKGKLTTFRIVTEKDYLREE